VPGPYIAEATSGAATAAGAGDVRNWRPCSNRPAAISGLAPPRRPRPALAPKTPAPALRVRPKKALCRPDPRTTTGDLSWPNTVKGPAPFTCTRLQARVSLGIPLRLLTPSAAHGSIASERLYTRSTPPHVHPGGLVPASTWYRLITLSDANLRETQCYPPSSEIPATSRHSRKRQEVQNACGVASTA